MPQNSDKKCSDKKPSRRPCIQSMEIPPSSSKQPSHSTVFTSTPCSPHTSRSENLSKDPSYKEIYCTSETCNNSEFCMKTLPAYCPFGPKKKNEDYQCTGPCQSGTAQDTKVTPRNLKVISVNGMHNKSASNEPRPPNGGTCPAVTALNTVKRSASLLEMLSSCCAVKATSPPPSLASPGKSSSSSSSSSLKTKIRREPSRIGAPKKTGSDTKMSCCADDEAMVQTTNLINVTDTGTHPITGTEIDACDIKCMGMNEDSTPTSTPDDGLQYVSPDLYTLPEEGLKCCSAELKGSLADIPKRTCLRTNFKLPEPELEPLAKGQPANIEQKIDSCSCTDMNELSTPKKCSCHFPPAFNQFGCTGNISGNCSCGNDDC